MTAARFEAIKAGSPVTGEAEQKEYNRLLSWERGSNAAKRAVRTKRAKYRTWPTRKNDHK